MPHVSQKMTAHGTELPCEGCGGTFVPGEPIAAFEHDNGDNAGWYCEQCCVNYKAWGRFDPELTREMARKDAITTGGPS